MKLAWDQVGERYYETGTDRGVFYPFVTADKKYGTGTAWNGLIGVSESPSGGEPSPYYADNIKYLNLMSTEEFGATIEAYTYPDEFKECDGSKEIAPGVYAGQQSRKPFGFSYRTILGNDTENNKYGYKIHLVYNAMAAPSEKGYATTGESTEPLSMSWEISTSPVDVPGAEPTAHLEIDSTKCSAEKLAALEAILYGTDDAEPTLPLPEEVVELLKETTGDDQTA